jgi:hypothetical protein
MTFSVFIQRVTRLLVVGSFIFSTIVWSASAYSRTVNNADNVDDVDDVDAVLDDFNRPGPQLGSNWSGTTAALDGNQLKGEANGLIYWQQSFGVSQHASVKIVQLPRCSGIDLILKASDNELTNGLIDVSYNTCASPKLLIYSYNPKYGHHSPFAGLDVALGPGDVFSASVHANHVVTVFINGEEVLRDVLASANAGFDVGRAGQIGLGLSSDAVVLDDFDGGSLDGTLPPIPTALPEITPTPLALDEDVYLPLVLRTKRN